MTVEILGWCALSLAALPAVLTIVNLLAYRRPRHANGPRSGRVSILIPARDEERVIAAAVEAGLASVNVDVEVLVLDDGSQDRTAAIVREIGERDPRVRLVTANALPEGWCGKQHACASLAALARHEWLLFQDADVTISPNAVADLLAQASATRTDLLSGVPHQQTETLGEKLIIPLIHFVLLGFLPLPAARQSARPAFAAGCGQIFLARREAYERAGGHAAIRGSMHDGLTLPKAFRTAGCKTDLVDLSAHARCRMYQGLGQVWQGFAKNAHEGMATPASIVPWTLLLGGGQVFPFVLATVLAITGLPGLALASGACALSLGTRFLLTARFRQSWLGALLHPVGVAAIVAIQWYALARRVRGRPVLWKGRAPA